MANITVGEFFLVTAWKILLCGIPKEYIYIYLFIYLFMYLRSISFNVISLSESVYVLIPA